MDPENDETQAVEEIMETKTNEADLQMAHNNQSSPKYPVAPTENAVRTFMARQHLTQYTEALVNQGYDDLTVLRYLPYNEVLEVANLVHMKPGHQAKFAWALAEETNELKQKSKHKRKRGKKERKKRKKRKKDKKKLKGKKPALVRAGLKQAKVESYVAMIVDRSGSMDTMGNEVMNGFNKFLEEQTIRGDTCIATVTRFDDQVDIMHHAVPIHAIPKANAKTFKPRGSTALLDAIGQTIQEMEQKMKDMSEKPKKIMVMILTDGCENASKLFTHKSIMDSIKRLEATGNWQFVYVAANQDAIKVGNSYGVQTQNCLSYDATPRYQRAACYRMNMNCSNFLNSHTDYKGFDFDDQPPSTKK